MKLNNNMVPVLMALLPAVSAGCSQASADEPAPPPGADRVAVDCWAAAADGSYEDFAASVDVLERCTTDDYSFAVVNPAMGEIRCFRGDGFCPLEQPGLSRAAVRLSGFAAGAARGEIGARHQISNLTVTYDAAQVATVTFRSTAYYFNEDGSFELGWGDHELTLIEEAGVWRIQTEDVYIPSPNRRIVADAHEEP